jgi:hypothetical protein
VDAIHAFGTVKLFECNLYGKNDTGLVDSTLAQRGLVLGTDILFAGIHTGPRHRRLQPRRWRSTATIAEIEIKKGPSTNTRCESDYRALVIAINTR